MCIYIYIYRERERERDTSIDLSGPGLASGPPGGLGGCHFEQRLLIMTSTPRSILSYVMF